MFTGLVQSIGQLRRCPNGVRLRLQGERGTLCSKDLALGDSVSVDGVCLTVAEHLGDGFRADISEETLGRTTLAAKASTGGLVNLEPALRLSDRLGGHLVSGHVDGLGVVCAIQREPASWRLELAWSDPSFGRYVCEKASIAVDGISLTVAGCDPSGVRFWIAVIPHTWTSTTLAERRVGDQVNLEADLLAKYTERLLSTDPRAAPTGRGDASPAGHSMDPPITASWLGDQGWLGS